MKNRIKELRKANKLSQSELADIVGTTRQTITSIEVGKYTASLGLAYKIARLKKFLTSVKLRMRSNLLWKRKWKK